MSDIKKISPGEFWFRSLTELDTQEWYKEAIRRLRTRSKTLRFDRVFNEDTVQFLVRLQNDQRDLYLLLASENQNVWTETLKPGPILGESVAGMREIFQMIQIYRMSKEHVFVKKVLEYYKEHLSDFDCIIHNLDMLQFMGVHEWPLTGEVKSLFSSFKDCFRLSNELDAIYMVRYLEFRTYSFLEFQKVFDKLIAFLHQEMKRGNPYWAQLYQLIIKEISNNRTFNIRYFKHYIEYILVEFQEYKENKKKKICLEHSIDQLKIMDAGSSFSISILEKELNNIKIPPVIRAYQMGNVEVKMVKEVVFVLFEIYPDVSNYVVKLICCRLHLFWNRLTRELIFSKFWSKLIDNTRKVVRQAMLIRNQKIDEEEKRNRVRFTVSQPKKLRKLDNGFE